MPIDFHAKENKQTYAGREAHADWLTTISTLIDPAGKAIADIGCGGGVYSAAWAALGARRVTGVDFSAQMVSDARETTRELSNVTIVQGGASHTVLADSSQDIVFARALIHHFDNRMAFLREARRILIPGGTCIIQDRTPEDVFLTGSAEHPRSWFFRSVSPSGDV